MISKLEGKLIAPQGKKLYSVTRIAAYHSRLITIGQTLYFLVTTLARVSQGLAITTMELTVLGFIFWMILASIFWWLKPSDVERGHVFELKKSMVDIIRDAGDNADVMYLHTPLDFVSREPWVGSAIWAFYVKILRSMGFFPQRHKARPIERISSFDFRKPIATLNSRKRNSRRYEIFGMAVMLPYLASFIAAWNFHFPTKTERLVGRASSIAQCGIFALVGTFELYYFAWPIVRRSNTESTSPTFDDAEQAGRLKKQRFRNVFHRFWYKAYNNSASRHPDLDVPLRSIIVTTPLCAAYVICRWYLLLEDLIALRSVHSSVYETVDWTKYWPSF